MRASRFKLLSTTVQPATELGLPTRAKPRACRALRYALVVGFALPLALAACGGDDTEGPDRGDTDRDTATNDTGMNDTGMDDTGGDADNDVTVDTGTDVVVDTTPTDTGADTTPVDTGGDVSQEPFRGVVAVFETRSDDIAEINLGGIAVNFTREPEVQPGTPVATFGDCDVAPTTGQPDLFATGPTLDGGVATIDIAGTMYTATIQDGADGPMYDAQTGEQSEFFADEQTIQINLAGGVDVPAFSGSVVAPSTPAVTSPPWGGFVPTPMPRDVDLVVSWSGTPTGEPVVVSLLPVDTSGIADGNGVTCLANDTGTLTIPAGALQMIPNEAIFGPNVVLTVVRTRTVDTTVGASVVRLNSTAAQTILGALE